MHQVMNIRPNIERLTIGDCRVSGHKQNDDLERQIQKMRTYLLSQGKLIQIIENIGCGIDYKKKGLRDLIKQIMQNKVDEVVVLN